MVSILKHGQDSQFIPDVVQIGSTWQGTLSYLGQLMDLSDDPPTENLDDFIPILLESCHLQSSRQLFSVPWFSDVRVLYYRKDILKKLNVTPKDFLTWEGFRQVLDKVKNSYSEKIFPLSLSGQSEHILIHDLAPWLWAANSDFVDLATKKSLIDQPSFQKATHFYFSLIDDKYVPLMGRDQITYGNFFNGAAAFQVSGAWPALTIFDRESDEYESVVAKNFGIAPVPSLNPQIPSTTFIGGSHLAIMASSQKKEPAKKLIRFLTDKSNHEIHARKIGVLPVRKSSFNSDFFGEHWHGMGTHFELAIQNARTLPSLPILGTIEQLVQKFTGELLDAVRNEKYNEQLLDQLAKKTSKELDYILSLYA